VKHWLIKSEPFVYSFDRLLVEGSTRWDGIRNYQARNNLREMKKGDLLLFYHSNEGLAIVGIAKVSKTAYADPSVEADAKQKDWSAVDVVPVRRLKRPVTLKEARTDPILSESALVKNSRLSVQPFTKAQYERVLELAKSTPA
jgi:predicted RNA-binding protein with PUA-like domain